MGIHRPRNSVRNHVLIKSKGHPGNPHLPDPIVKPILELDHPGWFRNLETGWIWSSRDAQRFSLEEPKALLKNRKVPTLSTQNYEVLVGPWWAQNFLKTSQHPFVMKALVSSFCVSTLGDPLQPLTHTHTHLPPEKTNIIFFLNIFLVEKEHLWPQPVLFCLCLGLYQSNGKDRSNCGQAWSFLNKVRVIVRNSSVWGICHHKTGRSRIMKVFSCKISKGIKGITRHHVTCERVDCASVPQSVQFFIRSVCL